MNDTEKEQVFRAIFQRYGPLPSFAELTSIGLNTTITGLQSLNKRVFCGYVDLVQFNAVASVYKGQDLICLFTGLSLYFSCYFNTLMSDPTVFPDIGDSSLERFHPDRNKKLLAPFAEDAVGELVIPPKCDFRAKIAFYLFASAHYFIYFHELAHIELCHVQLLTDEFHADNYEELPLNAISDEEARVRQELELQADQGAAFTSLHLWRRAWGSDWAADKRGLDADFLWSLSVNSIFLIFEQLSALRGQSKSRTHPSPLHRWINVLSYLMSKRASELADVAPLDKPKNDAVIYQIMNWWVTNGIVPIGESFIGKEQVTESIDDVVTELSSKRLDDRYLSRLRYYQEKRGHTYWDKWE